ncbi:MAG: UDP-N-acetylglucosamine 1-carboxyvinyltransferase [Holosporaceae bacterium]|jgi:UDP-N-acetylglucosamine 1-carboxyvinyltransferase|nr:UDP-N-acetylglucosamine 1-carboxyvinyltransferase [Holosporaceae bacterium]
MRISMIEKIKVYGKQKANGKVHISGAKNAALPLLAAALLSSDGMRLKNVPPLTDVTTMLALLENLGITYQVFKDSHYANSIKLKTDALENFTAPYEIVKKMRASALVLGPLLSRLGRCRVSLPGGCAIGVRPIDLHLKGMEALGATIELRDGYVHASAPEGLRGAEFTFPIVTVTGTENVVMAAVLANGTTVLKNAAREPEVVDLANCLNKMGANISGHGTETVVIHGVTSLRSTEHTVVPDRIEAGTYAIAAGITNGRIDLLGGDFRKLLPSFLDKMELAGLSFSSIDNGLRVESSGKILPIDVDTEPFPGYPTDLQAQCMAMLCLADGKSNIRENIWENRFMHVAELMRMGADISVAGTHAQVRGVKHLTAAPVMATDLRASFSLILAALAADGDTVIDRVYHLDRGYCCVKEKFADCGIAIERIK